MANTNSTKDDLAHKITWHIKAGIEWMQSAAELFPALWQSAATFAPLIVDYCPMCRKPLTVLWIPQGDHRLCEKLDDPEDRDSLYVNDSALPPI